MDLHCATMWVINQKKQKSFKEPYYVAFKKEKRCRFFWSSFTRDGSFASCLQEWVCRFEKPQTSPNSLSPSTTVLSPYVTFGCLSARLFWWKLTEVYQGVSVLVCVNSAFYSEKSAELSFCL